MAPKKKRPWLVFFGTSTAIVKASSRTDAYMAFLDTLFPVKSGGRVVPPAPDEVHLREMTKDDLDWIADAGDDRFTAAARKAFA